jgi:hypothetical protein
MMFRLGMTHFFRAFTNLSLSLVFWDVQHPATGRKKDREEETMPLVLFVVGVLCGLGIAMRLSADFQAAVWAFFRHTLTFKRR